MRGRSRRRPAFAVAVAACLPAGVSAAGVGSGTAGFPGDVARISGASPFARCATAPSFVDAEVEPAIASDPRRPNHLVAIYQPTVTADPRRPGTAYVVWSDYRRTSAPGTESDELVSVTHDGGRSWSSPRLVLRHGRRAGPEDGQILVDARSGRLYLLMAWVRDAFATPAEPAWMLIAQSGDGGVTWSKARRFGTGNPAAGRGGPVIRSSPQVPSFAIDARGVLYAAWQDARFHAGAREDVVLTRSSDGGKRWTPVRRISAASGAGAIIPTLAARGNGVLAALYLQLESGGTEARYRVSTSSGGGRRFHDSVISPTFVVTDAPRLTPSPLVPGGYFLGDYMGIAPTGGRAFATAFVMANAAGGNKTDVFFAPVGTR